MRLLNAMTLNPEAFSPIVADFWGRLEARRASDQAARVWDSVFWVRWSATVDEADAICDSVVDACEEVRAMRCRHKLVTAFNLVFVGKGGSALNSVELDTSHKANNELFNPLGVMIHRFSVGGSPRSAPWSVYSVQCVGTCAHCREVQPASAIEGWLAAQRRTVGALV